MMFLVLYLQSFYFIATGAWSLLYVLGFFGRSGATFDRTAGVLMLVVGLSLLVAAIRKRASLEVLVLAGGAALALLFMDVVYVFTGVIPPVYLLDAVLQGLIAGGLFVGKVRQGARLNLES